MGSKLFWENPYQTELKTAAVRIAGRRVQLSQTIFYAESGGQESDSGTINGIPVVRAEKQGLDIIYTLASAPDFETGDEVVVRIDWDRRYRLMRLHFAAELVLELFYQQHPHIKKIGAHIAQDKSRIDFEWQGSIAALLDEVQDAAGALIQADLPIVSAFAVESEEQRYWQIDGFARVSCGGTHLARTSEVGRILLKRKNIGKGKERVEIYLVPS